MLYVFYSLYISKWTIQCYALTNVTIWFLHGNFTLIIVSVSRFAKWACGFINFIAMKESWQFICSFIYSNNLNDLNEI